MSSEKTPKLSVLVSPGQGTHIKNMWSLAEEYPEVKAAYEIADQAVLDVYGSTKIDGRNVSEWSQGDNVAEISANTRIAQPLQVSTAIGLNEVIGRFENQKGRHFTTSYGNSLGELAALEAAGAISKEHAIKLSVIRGICSHEASQRTPGGMVVIKNGSHEIWEKMKHIDLSSVKRAINFSPHSITYAGTLEAVETIYETLQADYRQMVRRAKEMTKEEKLELVRAFKMKIPAAFHHSLMEIATADFNAGFREVKLHSPLEMLWFSNYSSQFEGDPRVIQEHLVNQLVHEVDVWNHIGKLILLGHGRFVESGTAAHITDEYRLQQKRGNLDDNVEFIFGLEELEKAA